ncbi:FapA family protein [Clostridium sp. ZBS15]|uniref:FapA family protein n=1 Tax=Clostridium sp. ZBS15 TaxID=2949969 RepID=UPI00207AEB3D|nr:FapA family protein [Clostridium sp. ZBS15]
MEFGAKVVNGKIIIVDEVDKELNSIVNQPITIKVCNNIELYINKKRCKVNNVYEVTSNDEIECKRVSTEEVREAVVNISKNKMKAFMTVNYAPKIEYGLKDKQCFLNLALTTEVISEKYPEPFSIMELKNILKEKGVIYGINEETLKIVSENKGKEIIVAQGEEPITDIPSEIKPLFIQTKMFFPDIDSQEKVDYKNLFRISNVKAGDKIAEIIPEVLGKDGINIFGKIVKKDYIRNEPIKTSKGCKIENNDVIALIDGKAHILNRSIGVNPVYSVESVNMETCNIAFYGDIEVYNSVDDHMSVNAGGALDVSHNVNTSNVVTGGEITILGSAISSKILCGQIDMQKKDYSQLLNLYKKNISSIISIMKQANLENMKMDFRTTLNLVIDTKFKDFKKISLDIVSTNIKNKIRYNKLVDLIRDKVLMNGMLDLHSMRQLNNFNNILDNELEYYNKNIIVPLDVKLNYCQDCYIKSTGNIIINGNGEYTSYLNAMKDIIFAKPNSVARGGLLDAQGNISAGIVGSNACVATALKVPKSGRISATIAYPNTKFCFGNSTLILEEKLENINVYYDEHFRSIEISKSAYSKIEKYS